MSHSLFKSTLFLVVGIVDWSVGTRDLRRLSGLARLMPTSAVAAAISVASMAGLGYALRELPVGTAYAVWTGIGAVGTALFGIAFLGEPASVGRIVCLALIVSGIVGLKLFS